MSRTIRDPVHGFVELSDVESELIDTAPFRRLRFIRQLGLTNYVYPGAEHSRFGHSLGVMQQATKFYDALIRKGLPWTAEERERGLQLLRIAALCHDLGHTPFSHSGEAVLPGGRHEDYSAAIVLADGGKVGEVRQVLEGRLEQINGVTPDDVAGLISGTPKGSDGLLHEILSGDLDADRTDYLRRDSVYCGVSYGLFDAERLTETLTWIEDESSGNARLAIESDGVHAAEGLILARYFMFTQVYFHRVRRAYDHHLVGAIGSLIGTYPRQDDLDEYMAFDDRTVWARLREATSDAHARRIVDRDHFREAYASGEHPNPARLRDWENLSRKVVERFGDDEVFIDQAEKAPHAFAALKGFPVVRTDGTQTWMDAESDVMGKLEPIRLQRLFAPRERVADVRAYCDDIGLNRN